MPTHDGEAERRGAHAASPGPEPSAIVIKLRGKTIRQYVHPSVE